MTNNTIKHKSIFIESQIHTAKQEHMEGLGVAMIVEASLVAVCFLHLFLKGNRRSHDLLLPFHFAKKEGTLC